MSTHTGPTVARGRRRMRGLYLAIEINLVLWLVVGGGALAGVDGNATYWWATEGRVSIAVATAGFLLAAVIQHWAYYALRGEPDAQSPGA